MPTDADLVQAVWEKGRGTVDWDTTEWRQDQCGAWLHRHEYNNDKSEYGWKIEKTTAGSSESVENLHPFHCKNAYDITNGKPHCHVAADRAGILPTQTISKPRNSHL